MTARAADHRALLALVLIGFALFGFTAPHAGLHLDDFLFHALFTRGSRADIWRMFLDFVPGRNLHVAYDALLYGLAGPSPVGLHAAGLALDLLNVGLFYALLRRLDCAPRQAFAAAGLFLVYPNHGETHFWAFAIAQNLAPTTLLLCAALWVSREDRAPGSRLAGALVLFLLALFDYDQAFLLWLPLLALGPRPSAKRGWAPQLAFAAACLAACLGHVLFRRLAAVSLNGRPMITLGRWWPSALEAARACLVPMVKLPRLEFLRLGPLGPAGCAALCAALGAVWALMLARLPGSSRSAGEAAARRRLLGVGLLWTACAYFPNLFWYVSPRHHYLPSAGFLMAAAAGASLAGIGRRPRAATLTLAAAAFGLAASFDLAEGVGWSSSARMLGRLGEALRADAPSDSVYVLDAPAAIGPAPWLGSPLEAAFLAADEAGGLPRFAAVVPAASRTGLFSGCESGLFGRETWLWRPYGGARALVYDGRGGFTRAGRLRVEPAGLPAVDVLLGDGSARARLAAPIWLVEARRVEPAHGTAASAGPSKLASCALRAVSPGALDLILEWTATPGPRRDLAFLLTLLDSSGNVFFSSTRPGKGGRLEAVWPAYDDLIPASAWSPSADVRETWRLASPPPPGAGPWRARLELFERGDGGSWSRAATLEAPVAAAAQAPGFSRK